MNSISLIITIGFVLWQIYVFNQNRIAIKKLKRFFYKEEAYSTFVSYDDVSNDNERNETSLSKSVKIKDVATEDAELKNLINDINAYIKKSKGTVAFSIIQNKTE